MNAVQEDISSLAEKLFDITRVWGGAMKTTPRETMAEEQLNALKSFLAGEIGQDAWKQHTERVAAATKSEQKAWSAFVRDPRRATLRMKYEDAHKATMVEGAASLGGGLVPTVQNNVVIGSLFQTSQLRRAGATVIFVDGTDAFRVPTTAWSGSAPIAVEVAAGSQMEPTLGSQVFQAYAYRAQYIASQEERMDARSTLERFLTDSAGWQFAQSENNHFAIGTGASQPQGIAVAASTGAASPGSTLALAFAAGGDTVETMYYSLPEQYRENGCWFGADATLKQIRQQKGASSGDYTWPTDDPARLLGRPVYALNNMASSGSVANVLVFCDPRFFFVVDFLSGGIEYQVFTETYAASAAVGWWFWKRADSHLLASDAAVGLKLR